MRIGTFFRKFGLAISLSVIVFAATPAQVFAQYADGQRCGPNIPAEQCPCPPNVKTADCKAIIGDWTPWETDNGTCSASPASVTNISETAIAQRMFVGVSDPSVATDILAKYDIGGIFLISSGSPARVSDGLIKSIPSFQTSAKTPLLIATDQEYTSTVNSFGLADSKSATDLAGMSYDAVKAEGERFGTALSAAGVNMDFAPDVDLLSQGNAVIANNNRAISSNPDVVTQKAKAFSEGLASKKVTPVIKHFPGHGRSSGDSHQTLPTTPSLSELEQSDLLPFKNLGHQAGMAVMIGHLNVPGLTNGKPASMSVDAYSYLRGTKIGFSGLVITDELAGMVGAGSGSLGSKVADSLNAGADMALFNVSSLADFESAFNEAKTAVKTGSDTTVREQKRLFGLNMPDTNVTATSSSTATVSNASCCSVASVSLAGNDNIEKVLSFLMGKGLTLAQAAGVVGNFQQEASPKVLPEIIQGGAMADANYIPVPGVGFGIAQWTPADRQQGLVNMAKSMNQPITSLEAQLAWLWEEMTNPSIQYSKVLAPLKASTTPEDAAYIFHRDFEQSNDSEAAVKANRGGPAKALYDKYADGTPLQGSNSTAGGTTATQASFTASTGSCSGGTGNGDFVFYTQWDPQSAWADHPFWGGTIAENGCGPTGAAEVIATWVDKKVTPIEVADYITSINAEGQGSRLPEVYAHFGLTAKPISGKDAIIAGLKAGGMIQISASGSTPFTSAGHFIIIRGITPDGQVLLGDPNSPGPGAMPGHQRADYNSRPWDLDTIFAAMDSTGVHSLNLVTKDKPASASETKNV